MTRIVVRWCFVACCYVLTCVCVICFAVLLLFVVRCCVMPGVGVFHFSLLLFIMCFRILIVCCCFVVGWYYDKVCVIVCGCVLVCSVVCGCMLVCVDMGLGGCCGGMSYVVV